MKSELSLNNFRIGEKAERYARFIAVRLGHVQVINQMIYSQGLKHMGRSKLAISSAFIKKIINKEKNFQRCFYFENEKPKNSVLKKYEVKGQPFKGSLIGLAALLNQKIAISGTICTLWDD